MQGKHVGNFLFISLLSSLISSSSPPFLLSLFLFPSLLTSLCLPSIRQHALGRLLTFPGGWWWPWAACFNQHAGVWLVQCSTTVKWVLQSCASSMETKLITVQCSKTRLTSPVLGVVSQIYCRAWTPQLALTMHCWHFSGTAQQE